MGSPLSRKNYFIIPPHLPLEGRGEEGSKGITKKRACFRPPKAETSPREIRNAPPPFRGCVTMGRVKGLNITKLDLSSI
jgi:hypothetical protein